MKKKKLLTKLKSFEKKFFNKHKGLALRVLLPLSLLTLILAYWSNSTLHPEVTKDFAKTSVMITSLEGSGGSGVVLESSFIESTVLTNRHICRLVTKGGFITRESNSYLITHYAMSKEHDLCLLKVNSNLGINTEIAKESPTKYSDAKISGHPALLPHTLTAGNFSGRMHITLMVGLKKCPNFANKTKKEAQKIANSLGDNILYCLWYGGIPVFETFDSQLVTGTILPGSSGSAVFNSNGEIAGLVFASRSRELSYALVVPQEYVRNFVENEVKDWKPAKTIVPDYKFLKRFVTFPQVYTPDGKLPFKPE